MKKTDAAILADFERTINVLESFGSAYAPREPKIALPALRDKLEQARAVLEETGAAFAAQRARTTEIERALDAFGRYLLAVAQSAAEFFDDPELVRDLYALVRRFLAEEPPAAAEPEPLTGRTTAQRRRDARLSRAADLLALLRRRGAPEIAAPPLALAELAARLAELHEKNKAARAAEAAFAAVRQARMRILYDPEDGVLRLVELIGDEFDRRAAAAHAAAARRARNGSESGRF